MSVDSLIPPNTTSSKEDLTNLERSELISRINDLEARLRTQTAQLAALSLSSPKTYDVTTPPKPKKTPKPFDPSSYTTRPIALKFSYIGTPYNGYEHTNNVTSAPPKPTIEEVLWKALRKARLIAPEIPEGADTSYDIVWDQVERAKRYGVGIEGMGHGKRGKERLELIWDGCGYSKCGRTDKGVSAFGQVITVTVRSNKPKSKIKKAPNDISDQTVTEDISQSVGKDVHAKESASETPWDPVRDELAYVTILNGLLPPTIRMLAWCPHPPPDFDARWICKERRYKYFFTNPAFCPTPGPMGLTTTKGHNAEIREGWLDIEAMRIAAKKLEGLHDFRNFCKIDASKQMTACQRRITFADVDEFEVGLDTFVNDTRLNERGSKLNGIANGIVDSVLGGVTGSGPKIYTFAVHGTAFLWHQVRCMVAVLFLVGQGLEKPEIVDELLDIVKNPGRPHYEMADDAPLVLWDCLFPGDGDYPGTPLEWVYAGDNASVSTMAARGDGKFGFGGIADSLWTQWREAKLKETLAAGLLGLALGQGDNTSYERGGARAADVGKPRSQKVFDGSDVPRSVGGYVPVMRKPKGESLEVQNAKYMNGKQARRTANRMEKEEANDGD